MITGLDLLFLEVNSLEESLAFYEGVLGMEVESVNNDSEPPMAKVRGGELRITSPNISRRCCEEDVEFTSLRESRMLISFMTS